MKYNDSVSDFFKSPHWKNNILLGAVCILIPVIGPLLLTGWHTTCLWARGNDDDPATAPPFDFQYFSKYLELGVWPFVVNLVASFVFIPVMAGVIIPTFFLSGIFDHPTGQGFPTKFIAIFSGILVLQIAMQLLYQVLIMPLTLGATLTQDFKSAFNFSFAKNFIARTWKESIASMIFMFGLVLCAAIIMLITCYIGVFFVMPVVIFSANHLQKQLYQLYLKRGGMPLLRSSKLIFAPTSY